MRFGEHRPGAEQEGKKLGLITCCTTGSLLYTWEPSLMFTKPFRNGHPQLTGAEILVEVTAGRAPEHVDRGASCCVLSPPTGPAKCQGHLASAAPHTACDA